MFSPSIIFLFVVSVLACMFFYWRKGIRDDANFNRIRAERDAAQDAAREKSILRSSVYDKFGVDLDTINERGTQDEIVRCVNLLACQAARDCVSHSRSADSKDDSAFHAACSKRKWAEKRSFALEVCPELKSRMPHFGEFEPLKSYNAEHLIQAPEVISKGGGVK